MRHIAAVRNIVLPLVAIAALLLPRHAPRSSTAAGRGQFASQTQSDQNRSARPWPTRPRDRRATWASRPMIVAPTLACVSWKYGRGPAEAAGLEVGDLIAAVHGKAVRTVDDFAVQLKGMSVGTHVVFDIERGGQSRSIEVVLGTKQSVAAVPQIRLGPLPSLAANH